MPVLFRCLPGANDKYFPGCPLLQTWSAPDHSLWDEKANCYVGQHLLHLWFQICLAPGGGGGGHAPTASLVAVFERRIHTSWRAQKGKNCADVEFQLSLPPVFVIESVKYLELHIPWQLIHSANVVQSIRSHWATSWQRIFLHFIYLYICYPTFLQRGQSEWHT